MMEENGGDIVIKRKHILVLALAFCLTVTLFTVTSTGYDPWVDQDEDGDVDAADLNVLAGDYGSTGNPTKNVSVTNWPASSQSSVLRLRGTKATSGDDTIHHLLIDEETPYPNQNVPPGSLGLYVTSSRVDQEWVSTHLWGIVQVYEHDFIYERNPPEGYVISGMPTVSLTFNVSKMLWDEPIFALVFYADLYKYSIMEPETSWTRIVQFGNYEATYASYPPYYNTNWQHNIWFGDSMYEPVYVAPHERLALRVTVWGSCADPAGVDLTLKLLHTMNTDEFLVSIPVQYEQG